MMIKAQLQDTTCTVQLFNYFGPFICYSQSFLRILKRAEVHFFFQIHSIFLIWVIDYIFARTENLVLQLRKNPIFVKIYSSNIYQKTLFIFLRQETSLKKCN